MRFLSTLLDAKFKRWSCLGFPFSCKGLSSDFLLSISDDTFPIPIILGCRASVSKLPFSFSWKCFLSPALLSNFVVCVFERDFYNFLKGISSWPEISRRLFGSFLWHRFWLNIFQPELTKWIVFYFSFKIYLPSNVEKYTNILGQRSRFLCLLFVIRRLHKTALQQWLP